MSKPGSRLLHASLSTFPHEMSCRHWDHCFCWVLAHLSGPEKGLDFLPHLRSFPLKCCRLAEGREAALIEKSDLNGRIHKEGLSPRGLVPPEGGLCPEVGMGQCP